VDKGLTFWTARVIIVPNKVIKSQPCYAGCVFTFNLGYVDREEDAKEIWKSLGFTLPPSVEILFESVQEEYSHSVTGHGSWA
jgi:hypothetical protein